MIGTSVVDCARVSGTSAEDRRVLMRNGYEPIPICGKGPRWPWRRDAITDELLTTIENNPMFADHTNTGLRTGHLVGIDIDVVARDHVEIVKKAAFAELGQTSVQRVGSKGALLCYYNPDPIRKLTISGRLPDSEHVQRLVEFLGNGQQAAAYGVHPTTGKPYQWTYAVDDEEPLCRKLLDLPHVTPNQLRIAAQKIGEALSANGFLDVSVNGLEPNQGASSVRYGDPVSLSWIRDALRAIPPDVSRQEWLSVIWAVKDACIFPDVDDSDRVGLLDQWSSGELSEKGSTSYRGYGDVACNYDWAKGNAAKAVTVGTMSLIAQKYGFQGGPPRVKLMELANDNFLPQDWPEEPASTPDNRWAKLTRQGRAIFEMPPAGMIVPGWLRDRGFTGILAQRGTGKTVVAVGLGLAIASNKNWMGEPVASGYYVVYLCGEDKENTAAHIEAWCNRYNGSSVPSRFIFVEDVPNLLSVSDCRKLVTHLKTIIPNGGRAVIIADTWQRATNSATDGQNSDRDMAAAAASLEDIANACDGSAVACFHPPKGEKHVQAPSVHGSAVIENTSTGIWTLVADDAGLKLEVTRIKGMGLGNFKRVRLEGAGLGRADTFGCELTGNIAVHEGGAVSGLSNPAEREKIEHQYVLEAVRSLLGKNITIVRANGIGQKPLDVADEVKMRTGLTLDKRRVLHHLNGLEREGRLGYRKADRNSRLAAGFYIPSACPAERAAEGVPNALPNTDEDF